MTQKNWFYTDYPILALGDKPGEAAPIRECELLSYDGDKYVTVKVEGIEVEFKAGYLYIERGRFDASSVASPKLINRILGL